MVYGYDYVSMTCHFFKKDCVYQPGRISAVGEYESLWVQGENRDSIDLCVCEDGMEGTIGKRVLRFEARGEEGWQIRLLVGCDLVGGVVD